MFYAKARLIAFEYFGFFCVVSFVCSGRLSVPVQVIEWKDSSLK